MAYTHQLWTTCVVVSGGNAQLTPRRETTGQSWKTPRPARERAGLRPTTRQRVEPREATIIGYWEITSPGPWRHAKLKRDT